MENTTSSKARHGSSTIEIDIPDPLPYPKILPFSESNLSGKFCYIFKRYSTTNGIAAIIKRDQEYVTMRFADFTGKLLDLKKDRNLDEVLSHTSKLVIFMKYARITKTIFYFAIDEKIRLVDMRMTLNKFVSPGFIRDMFGKLVPIQEAIGSPVILKDEILDSLVNGKGDYASKNFIIKPSAFKFIVRDDDILPQYGVLGDETKSIT